MATQEAAEISSKEFDMLFAGSDKQIFDKTYRSLNDPIGIYLLPAIAGRLALDPGIDEQAFLTREPIFDNFDPTIIEQPRITITKFPEV